MITFSGLRMTAFAAALALGGCVLDGARHYGSSYPAYATDVARMAAADGPVPVSMSGAPFAPSEIVSAMNAMPNVHRMIFAADGKPGAHGYRIALSFDKNATSPCGSSDQIGAYPLPKRAGSGEVVAALCRHSGLISRTVGMYAETASASDPKFRKFMSDVVHQLMPPFEPDRIGGDGCGRRGGDC